VCREDVGKCARDEMVPVCRVDFEQVVTERQIRPRELDCVRRQVRHEPV